MYYMNVVKCCDRVRVINIRGVGGGGGKGKGKG